MFLRNTGYGLVATALVLWALPLSTSSLPSPSNHEPRLGISKGRLGYPAAGRLSSNGKEKREYYESDLTPGEDIWVPKGQDDHDGVYFHMEDQLDTDNQWLWDFMNEAEDSAVLKDEELRDIGDGGIGSTYHSAINDVDEAQEDIEVTWPPHHPHLDEPIDLSRWTIRQILNWTLYHHDDPDKETLPIYKLAWAVNKTREIEEANDDDQAGSANDDKKKVEINSFWWYLEKAEQAGQDITLLAPDDEALSFGHHGEEEVEQDSSSEFDEEIWESLYASDSEKEIKAFSQSEGKWNPLTELLSLHHTQSSLVDDDGDDHPHRRPPHLTPKQRVRLLKLVSLAISYHALPKRSSIDDLKDLSTFSTYLPSFVPNDPHRIVVPSSNHDDEGDQGPDFDRDILGPPSRIRLSGNDWEKWLPSPGKGHDFRGLDVNFYAKVRGRSVKAKNGYIHLLNKPLLPPLSTFNELLLFPSIFSTLTSSAQQIVFYWLWKQHRHHKHHNHDSENKDSIFKSSSFLGGIGNRFGLEIEELKGLFGEDNLGFDFDSEDAAGEALSSLLMNSQISEEGKGLVDSMLDELMLGYDGNSKTKGDHDHDGDKKKRWPDTGKLTVFAPSNKAWEKLGFKLAIFLHSPFGVKYLAALLAYHTIPNVLFHSDYVETFSPPGPNPESTNKYLLSEEIGVQMKEATWKSIILEDDATTTGMEYFMSTAANSFANDVDIHKPPVNVNISHYSLPTALKIPALHEDSSSIKHHHDLITLNLTVDVVSYRNHFGHGNIQRKIVVNSYFPPKKGHGEGEIKPVTVSVGDATTRAGAVHVVPNVLLPDLRHHHRHH